MRTGFQLKCGPLPILKIWIIIWALAVAPLIEAFDSKEPHLVFDAPNAKHLPIRFRQATDYQYLLPKRSHNFKGLETLLASASGQFSRYQLENMLKILPVAKSEVWIIDLRQESHAFIDDYAFSWYGPKNQLNEHMSNRKVLKTEEKLLKQLAKEAQPIIFTITVKENSDILDAAPTTFVDPQLMFESEMVNMLGAHYQRFFITDHKAPLDSEVDRFLHFYHALPKGAWLHFHCRGGKGRATTFFAMKDILENSKQVDFDDIIKRHGFIGPKDLSKLPNEGSWKLEDAKQRLAFLKTFYDYTQSDQTMLFSQWQKQQV